MSLVVVSTILLLFNQTDWTSEQQTLEVASCIVLPLDLCADAFSYQVDERTSQK